MSGNHSQVSLRATGITTRLIDFMHNKEETSDFWQSDQNSLWFSKWQPSCPVCLCVVVARWLMSLLKACEPTCDELSQKSPAVSLKTTFWSAVGGRWSLESVSSMQSYRLHTVSKTSPILDDYCFVYQYMFHSRRCCLNFHLFIYLVLHVF